jgi:hypothetical protein
MYLFYVVERNASRLIPVRLPLPRVRSRASSMSSIGNKPSLILQYKQLIDSRPVKCNSFIFLLSLVSPGNATIMQM